MYYLNSRYYNPEIGRFINADDTQILILTQGEVIGHNLYTYSMNNPVMMIDENGYLPNWAKWAIGISAFTAAVALTAATGGALAPVFMTMGISIISGGLINGAYTSSKGGDFWDGFSDGAADGAMWGGIFSLGGSLIRTAKLFKNGVVVGEGMSNVNAAAKEIGAVTYKGMPGYKVVKIFKGASVADDLAMAHNKAWMTRMTKWGVKVTDIGIDLARTTGRSKFYAMEFSIIRNYAKAIFPYL